METVLVIDDERIVSLLIRTALQIRGYTVLDGSEDSPEAAARAAGPIHLLITDVNLPNADCRKMVEQCRSRHPGIKVIYMSGYPQEVVTQFGVCCPSLHFLQKPFTLEHLAQKVRQVLDSGKDAGTVAA